MNLESIISVVAKNYGCQAEDLKARSRRADLVAPRQVAMYLARKMIDSSTLKEVGAALGGRSPATVTYGFQKIARLLSQDEEFARRIERIRQEMETVNQEEERQRYQEAMEFGAMIFTSIHRRYPSLLEDEAFADVAAELDRADSKFPPIDTLHAGYAILQAALAELRTGLTERRDEHLYWEAMQVASQAVKLMIFIKETEALVSGK